MDYLEGLNVSSTSDAPVHPKAFATVQRQGKTANLSNQFADILAAAGLREKVVHSKKGTGKNASRSAGVLSFHCLRHTAVSLMKDAGIPEAVVMDLVGHDSEQMSAHYTHVWEEALKRATGSRPALF